MWDKKPMVSNGDTGNGSRVEGKKWACLGDSITASADAYHKWIAQSFGVIPLNYGVSATTVGIRSGRTDSMLERYLQMNADVDIITVLGGTNDFGAAQNVPLGTYGSTDTSTFFGAYDALLKGLIEKYPGKSIGVFTPLPRRGATASLKNYADAVIQVAAKYAVPCLDLFRSAGLDPNVDVINNSLFMTIGAVGDGLHPNAEGHKILARRIIGFLESI